jgi:transposase
MYLKVTTDKRTGGKYMSMVRKYYDPEKKMARETTVESFGYIDKLKDKYEDPVAHFREYVQERNREEEREAAEYALIVRKDAELLKNTCGRKNLGYAPILSVFCELGLDRFFVNRQRGKKFAYNTASIMKLLVISRIIDPCSKKRTYENRMRYFDFEREGAFSLNDVYHTLSHVATLENAVQAQIHRRIANAYGRNTEFIYYDVTNYYFEIEREDELKAKGVSKEHRPDPIVQMGLALDADGLPISYELFAGNDSEKLHLRPMIGKLRREYETGRLIAVADAAQNTGNNIYYLESGKCRYVFSQTIRGGSKEFKEWVLEDEGYTLFSNEYKRKSRLIRREISIDTTKDGKPHKKNVLVDQRQIVFYSEKYAVRARAKRESAIQKAYRIVKNPAAYTKATSHGALKYITGIGVDKKTGGLHETVVKPYIDFDKIREDEKWDGYYCIVTDLFDEDGSGRFTDDKIIDIYRGLWRIEDSFRVTKSNLAARPVYLSRHDRIRSHFLVCFISLVILRLIEKRLGGAYPPSAIIEAMNNISCSPESENLFLFDYRSEVTDAIGNAFGIDFTRQRLSRAAIRNILANAKNG